MTLPVLFKCQCQLFYDLKRANYSDGTHLVAYLTILYTHVRRSFISVSVIIAFLANNSYPLSFSNVLPSSLLFPSSLINSLQGPFLLPGYL